MFKNIKFIKDFGIFKNAKTVGGESFHQFNLIYGFNYSGKTTLSRIFRSIELGEKTEGFETGSFEINKHDGNSIKSNALQKVDNLRVFNSDYIAKNVDFDESSVDPVLIVGERNIDLEDELKRLREEVPVLENNKANSIIKSATKTTERNNRLTAVGRNVKQLNILGTAQFNAANVKPMLLEADVLHLKTAEELGALLETARSDVVSSVTTATIAVPNMITELSNVEEILAVSVTQITIAELEANHALKQWVEKGIDHHQATTTCQFCQSEVTVERLEQLNNYFSDTYKTLSKRIESAIADILGKSVTSSMPDKRDLYTDLQTGFDDLKDQAEPIKLEFEAVKNALVALLEDKKSKMAEVVPFNGSDYPLPDPTDLLAKINASIFVHNERASNHSTEKTNAINTIKRHYVYQETQDYNHSQALTEIEALDIVAKNAGNDIRTKNERIEVIEAELNNINEGAEKLNDNLRQYFGKTDITIKLIEGTYQFIREERKAKHLSDGERTAIAFAYFITQLEDEALQGVQPIVYIDDPICSLDSNHIYNVLGIIKSKLNHDKVEQLFISTHNFEFFNLVKMWLSHYKEVEGNFKRTRYFLINRKDNESRIDRLPDLLKDHRSEYAYLISKVKEAIERPYNCDAVAVQSYVRKVMEVYFSFRFNLTQFREYGVDNIALHFLKGAADAEVQSNTLYEYMNEKCHAKSIEVGMQLPAAVQPQLAQVWDIVTTAIKVNDKPHYDAYYA
ncbi:AAA family ATPase [Vibrio sp. 10N.261.46.E12]|uniref:AAA family ATPase n=2 Tax=Vibrio TaxID=662 RepID=UPI000976907E|nr:MULTISPECIES: AAA family ATPase [unclassified Vibrio]OMO36646.1 hypothetical protein BH584_25370 [Vibrio sp. 10N.261.45.E1]PMJ27531.1 hypothetical protein BCU27_07930 [Vibrio sp. 10N.286.45.B6]PML87926.1 hypothetical protein BCT66_11110 [Vibrio sp. 10N.261.49.E11]PMM64795.1 hypothetical protein BCT48_20590 [Vibrio sp. 10N.261.46.F12]PMM84392.1 hypothetical protein BCT46_10805 [Vibrio sp. 10N.261.46.E8]